MAFSRRFRPKMSPFCHHFFGNTCLSLLRFNPFLLFKIASERYGDLLGESSRTFLLLKVHQIGLLAEKQRI